jgi:Protein of unknown function (DUF4244)
MSTVRTVIRRIRTGPIRGRQGDSGMSTAEYAVGTVAACGFGGVLYKVVTSAAVMSALSGLIHRALNIAF